jgi:MYXO-CTERM domain-containing protein
LGGVQGVYADAKSSVANPEPRLGWTRLGDFEVVDVADGGAAMDGATRDGGARDGGTGEPVQGGCGCRVSGASSSRTASWVSSAAVMVLGISVARRGRRRASRSA